MLARGADIFEVLSGLASLHLRDDMFAGEVFTHLAAGALEWCGASRADPLALEVAYIRAAASRAGILVGQACQKLNERSGHQAPCRL